MEWSSFIVKMENKPDLRRKKFGRIDYDIHLFKYIFFKSFIDHLQQFTNIIIYKSYNISEMTNGGTCLPKSLLTPPLPTFTILHL
jgi:hypothetical protein